VCGGAAPVSSEDRQPHLPAADVSALLTSALATFKREHPHPVRADSTAGR
jgi:hypothetical protein